MNLQDVSRFLLSPEILDPSPFQSRAALETKFPTCAIPVASLTTARNKRLLSPSTWNGKLLHEEDPSTYLPSHPVKQNHYIANTPTKALPSTTKVRTWTERSGSSKGKAEFGRFREEKVHLHKLSSVKIAVPVSKQSGEELKFVEQLISVSHEDLRPVHHGKPDRRRDYDESNALSAGVPPIAASPDDRPNIPTDEATPESLDVTATISQAKVEEFEKDFWLQTPSIAFDAAYLSSEFFTPSPTPTKIAGREFIWKRLLALKDKNFPVPNKVRRAGCGCGCVTQPTPPQDCGKTPTRKPVRKQRMGVAENTIERRLRESQSKALQDWSVDRATDLGESYISLERSRSAVDKLVPRTPPNRSKWPRQGWKKY